MRVEILRDETVQARAVAIGGGSACRQGEQSRGSGFRQNLIPKILTDFGADQFASGFSRALDSNHRHRDLFAFELEAERLLDHREEGCSRGVLGVGILTRRPFEREIVDAVDARVIHYGPVHLVGKRAGKFGDGAFFGGPLTRPNCSICHGPFLPA